MASSAAATTEWNVKARQELGRKGDLQDSGVWTSFGSMGPDNRVANCLVTSFQGPHVPETSTVTSPKSPRGKTAHCLIGPRFPLGVFLGSLSHIAAGVRKRTPRQPGRQGWRWAAGTGCLGIPRSPGLPPHCLGRSMWGLESPSGQGQCLFKIKPQTQSDSSRPQELYPRGEKRLIKRRPALCDNTIDTSWCRVQAGGRPVSHHHRTQRVGCGVISQREGKRGQEGEGAS